MAAGRKPVAHLRRHQVAAEGRKASLYSRPAARLPALLAVLVFVVSALESWTKHGHRPELPVLLTSGFNSSLSEDTMRDVGIRELIAKPVSLDALAALVHRTLEQR